MSDLAQAAGSGVTQQVGQETWELLPLDLKDLGALERQALKSYKDQTVESYVEMYRKYLPPKELVAEIKKVIDKYAVMDVDALPEKDTLIPEKQTDGSVKETQTKLPYAAWWMTKTFDGMLHFVWYSARKAKPGMTLDECAAKTTIGGGQGMLNKRVDVVEETARPTLGGN